MLVNYSKRYRVVEASQLIFKDIKKKNLRYSNSFKLFLVSKSQLFLKRRYFFYYLKWYRYLINRKMATSFINYNLTSNYTYLYKLKYYLNLYKYFLIKNLKSNGNGLFINNNYFTWQIRNLVGNVNLDILLNLNKNDRKIVYNYSYIKYEKYKFKQFFGIFKFNTFKRYYKNKLITTKLSSYNLLINYLEHRLINYVYRVRIAYSFFESIQYIKHGFIEVNNQVITKFSYVLNSLDLIKCIDYVGLYLKDNKIVYLLKSFVFINKLVTSNYNLNNYNYLLFISYFLSYYYKLNALFNYTLSYKDKFKLIFYGIKKDNYYDISFNEYFSNISFKLNRGVLNRNFNILLEKGFILFRKLFRLLYLYFLNNYFSYLNKINYTKNLNLNMGISYNSISFDNFLPIWSLNLGFFRNKVLKNVKKPKKKNILQILRNSKVEDSVDYTININKYNILFCDLKLKRLDLSRKLRKMYEYNPIYNNNFWRELRLSKIKYFSIIRKKLYIKNLGFYLYKSNLIFNLTSNFFRKWLNISFYYLLSNLDESKFKNNLVLYFLLCKYIKDKRVNLISKKNFKYRYILNWRTIWKKFLYGLTNSVGSNFSKIVLESGNSYIMSDFANFSNKYFYLTSKLDKNLGNIGEVGKSSLKVKSYNLIKLLNLIKLNNRIKSYQFKIKSQAFKWILKNKQIVLYHNILDKFNINNGNFNNLYYKNILAKLFYGRSFNYFYPYLRSWIFLYRLNFNFSKFNLNSGILSGYYFFINRRIYNYKSINYLFYLRYYTNFLSILKLCKKKKNIGDLLNSINLRFFNQDYYKKSLELNQLKYISFYISIYIGLKGKYYLLSLINNSSCRFILIPHFYKIKSNYLKYINKHSLITNKFIDLKFKHLILRSKIFFYNKLKSTNDLVKSYQLKKLNYWNHKLIKSNYYLITQVNSYKLNKLLLDRIKKISKDFYFLKYIKSLIMFYNSIQSKIKSTINLKLNLDYYSGTNFRNFGKYYYSFNYLSSKLNFYNYQKKKNVYRLGKFIKNFIGFNFSNLLDNYTIKLKNNLDFNLYLIDFFIKEFIFIKYYKRFIYNLLKYNNLVGNSLVSIFNILFNKDFFLLFYKYNYIDSKIRKKGTIKHLNLMVNSYNTKLDLYVKNYSYNKFNFLKFIGYYNIYFKSMLTFNSNINLKYISIYIYDWIKLRSLNNNLKKILLLIFFLNYLNIFYDVLSYKFKKGLKLVFYEYKFNFYLDTWFYNDKLILILNYENMNFNFYIYPFIFSIKFSYINKYINCYYEFVKKYKYLKIYKKFMKNQNMRLTDKFITLLKWKQYKGIKSNLNLYNYFTISKVFYMNGSLIDYNSYKKWIFYKSEVMVYLKNFNILPAYIELDYKFLVGSLVSPINKKDLPLTNIVDIHGLSLYFKNY